MLSNTPIAVALLAGDGRILSGNNAFCHMLSAGEFEENPQNLLSYIDERHRDDVRSAMEARGDARGNTEPLSVVLQAEGAERSASLYVTHMQEPGEDSASLLVYLVDRTEEKNLEVKYAHSQKMQAVGQLAGGIAHDFNNLLTAMIGFCDLLLMRHPAGDQSFADIMQIKQNANRAANLVRQLLAFSRRQTLQPKMLDITDVLGELSNLISRLIGESIELKMVHGRDLGMVKVDQGQLEQVIINLAVNARDAMVEGGTLTIKTACVTVDGKHSLDSTLIAPSDDEPVPEGEYVAIEVIDTGHGIPLHIIEQIFEPFFSTKEVGAGTGLGLSTVYGIIRQTGGHIFVESREGEGTRFVILFRRFVAEEGTEDGEGGLTPERKISPDLTGKNTILLVEDEEPVRAFSSRALGNKGYTVLEADCAEAALEIVAEKGQEIEIIITDVVMPGMNGPEMIAKISKDYPDIRVIFISGYAEDDFLKGVSTDIEFSFLPKPYTLKQLASKVKEVASQ